MKKALISFIVFIGFTAYGQKMPECWYRSMAASERGEYSNALQWIDTCLLNNSKNYFFWKHKGEIQFNLGDYSNSIESLLHSEKQKKGSASFLLAKCYAMISDTAETLKWLRLHLALSEKEKESKIKLDPAFKLLALTEQWKRLWDKEWYSTYDRLTADIEYHISNSRWDDALDLLNQRLNSNRKRHQLLAYRAKVFFELGSYKMSVDDFTSAIKKSKKNFEYYNGRALSNLMLGRNTLALKDIVKAIELSGGNPKYFKTRAQIYFNSKDYSNAFNDISYYSTFYPLDLHTSILFIQIAIESGNYVSALFQLSKLIKVNPEDAQLFFYRGIVYQKTANYQFAEQDLNIAIDKKYKLVEAYYYRALCRINLLKKEEACSDLEQAIKLGHFKSQELYYNHCKKPATKW